VFFLFAQKSYQSPLIYYNTKYHNKKKIFAFFTILWYN